MSVYVFLRKLEKRHQLVFTYASRDKAEKYERTTALVLEWLNLGTAGGLQVHKSRLPIEINTFWASFLGKYPIHGGSDGAILYTGPDGPGDYRPGRKSTEKRIS